MIAAEPQKSQRCAARLGSNTVIAWQLWHFTDFFSVAHPRWSGPISRSAVTRSCSSILPSALISAGETVPQYGHTRACFPGFHCASAPQLGQLYFCWALISSLIQGTETKCFEKYGVHSDTQIPSTKL